MADATWADLIGARYSVDLWDHERGKDGAWSTALAEEHLEGPASGLRLIEIGRAIRMLRRAGWGLHDMYVAREDG